MQTKYRLYLVLDFINGGHLFFQLYHHGLFREDLARIYTAEIVSALSHLHANGIMHRDLKPENILLDEDGHAILTDFGLAKQLEENTRSNSMCGTVEYMSPEIIFGKGHDKAADWWSVGILLFEMLSGKDLARIYTAEIVSALSYLHANGIMLRDLKPENILLEEDGHVLSPSLHICACASVHNHTTNSTCGTVEYMSPEIILGKGHDKAADWWSVGILLFEMLSGKVASYRSSKYEIQQKIIKDKIKLPAFLSSEAHTLLKGEPSRRLDSLPK
ncbi:serine threonine- kinase 2 19-like [Olea europaea subsp. europaea]|uniref:Serine threonine- kinase 2 19-like n=1 Tax=Olea europaea subsp. europaea TaxID=158383 RepID=A0A8S0QT61_OLEEU|nr:serine threonine- kinase 2 19-like [Olea europaea subsp. europaea]